MMRKLAFLMLIVIATEHGNGGESPERPTRFVQFDLQPWGNLRLNQDFHLPGNNLKLLPIGKQKLDDVKFLIGEKLIHLAGKRTPAYPETAEGIAVNYRVKRIHFLQSGGWGVAMSDGIAIGEYRMHYDDGTSVSNSIVYGEDIRDWWMFDDRAATRATVVWTGLNHASRSFQGDRFKLRLYKMTWENPRPEQKITHFDFVSYNNSVCSPFLIAASAELEETELLPGESATIYKEIEAKPQHPTTVIADSNDTVAIAKLRDIGAFLEFDAGRKLIKVSLSGAGPRKGRPRGTEETVKWVSSEPTVEFLDLAWSSVTNDALKSIGQMPNIRSLNLNFTQITDEGIGHLKTATSLEHLWLHSTQLTDVGLEELKQLTKLRMLDLSKTQITDAGLSSLETLTNLEALDLRETNTTEAQVDDLRQKLPKVKIKR